MRTRSVAHPAVLLAWPFISSSFASAATPSGSSRTWIRARLKDRRKRGLSREHLHRTRMVPKRADELLDGGSLYWVIRGEVMCRQRLIDIRPFVDKEGVGRCHLVLEPKLTLVEPRPRRAFQGWRYLEAKDCSARPRPRRARQQEHAGGPATRASRARRCCDQAAELRTNRQSLLLAHHRDIVDQARLADPGGDQQPDRAILGGCDRLERVGVAGFEIVEREACTLDRRAAFVEHAGEQLARARSRRRNPQARDAAWAPPPARLPTNRRCVTTERGRPARARSGRRRSSRGRSRSFAIRVTTLSC